MEISTQKERAGTVPEYSSGIIEALASEYRCIVKVNLQSGKAVVLKSAVDTEAIGVEMSYESMIERFVRMQVYPDDRHLLTQLTLEQLRSNYEGKDRFFPLELRCFCIDTIYDWVKIDSIPIPGEENQLLITMWVSNEDRIMRKIIDLYVYKNFDYFILLNVKTNSYTMFSSKKGTPLPPSVGDDYEAEVRRYNTAYVVPEEMEWVTANMSIVNIQNKLMEQEDYAFTAGCIDDNGNYRRVRIQFTYYDKPAGLVVVTRIDITQVYLEESKKEQKLKVAMREAKHDSMTGLYNKKATTELINSALRSQYRAQAAILFIDIDNFKLVNDTFGHQKGDELLTYLGGRLAKIAGKDGIAGRIGGDEFLLFLPVVQGIEKIQMYAQEICFILKGQKEFGIETLPISCSVGISMYPRDGTDYEQLLYRADQALYDAKRYGKCQCAFYSLQAHGAKRKTEVIKERNDRCKS